MKGEYRICPFCGGVAQEMWSSNDKHKRTTAQVICPTCGTASKHVWKGSNGEKEMIRELERVWNHNIYDEKIKEKDEVIAGLSMSEADIMRFATSKKQEGNMEQKYSKPNLSRKQFIKESGYPESYVDRAIHGKYRDKISYRTSDAVNAKIMIRTEEFEWYEKEGCFV